MTNGATEEIRHRYVRVNPDEETIDLTKPMYVSLFGAVVEEVRLRPGQSRRGGRRPISSGWTRASAACRRRADADVYGYTVQDYDDSPDFFVGGADLKAAKQITTTNAFQSNYAWGKSEIVDYKTDKGDAAAGGTLLPRRLRAG